MNIKTTLTIGAMAATLMLAACGGGADVAKGILLEYICLVGLSNRTNTVLCRNTVTSVKNSVNSTFSPPRVSRPAPARR